MPSSIKWDGSGVYLYFSGQVSLNEICNANEAMFNSPQFDDLTFFIVDTTQINEITFTINEIDKVAAMDGIGSSYKTTLKAAFVVPNAKIKDFIKRYITTTKNIGSTWDIMMFETLQDARMWTKG